LMGNIGFPEMIVIFVVALLVFGPKRLPELGKSLGRGLSEFRRASSDLKNSIEREIEAAEIEQSIADTQKATEKAKYDIKQSILDPEEATAADTEKATAKSK
ncbi:MAG: TatA/E family twin arginine-targeting protein translocase, partial [Rhodospirillales bacterium]